MAVISVRCLGRGAEPLLPLKEALASYLGRTPDQIRRTLARAAPALLDAVPFIGAFLASIGEKLAEGSFSLRGVYEELSRILIKATSGNAGLFLLVDDLHAADPDTLYFLNYLFRKLRQVPVLVAATIQEEQLSDYPELADLMAEWSAAGHVTLTVVPLERAHVGEYVRMMSAAGEPGRRVHRRPPVPADRRQSLLPARSSEPDHPARRDRRWPGTSSCHARMRSCGAGSPAPTT